jgi:hypothetical protein
MKGFEIAMSTHRAKFYRPPPVPFVVRAAIVMGAGLFLSWLTWHFILDLRPKRIDKGASHADSQLEYQILDFAQEWASVQNLFHGEPIYGDQEQALHRYLGYVRNKDNPAENFSLQVNAHPPTSVLLAVPFCWLDYADAFLAWNLLSLVCFAVSLWVVIRQLGLRVTGWGLLAAWALLLFCNPFRQQINQGNLNLLLMLLFAAAWALERSEKPGWAGLVIGLATAIKLFPGFLLVYYAARGRWRVVIAGTLTVIGLTLLTLPVVGLDTYVSYYRDAMPKVTIFRGWWINASLPGLFNKLLDGSSGHTLPLVANPALAMAMTAAIIVILCAVLFVATRRARTRREHDLTFGLAVVTLLLIAPLTWDHYFLLLLVPLAVLWKDLRRLGNWQWLFLIALAALWLPPKSLLDLFLKPGENGGQIATPIQVLTLISYQCYGLLLLFAVNAAACWRERRMVRQKESHVEKLRKDSDPETGILGTDLSPAQVAKVVALSGREV